MVSDFSEGDGVATQAYFSGETGFSGSEGTVLIDYPWYQLKAREEFLAQKRNYVSDTAKIGANVVIENSYIGENVRVRENSVIENSYIGDDSMVGNFSLVRDSILGAGCMVGAYAEIARSVLKDDVSMHSGYIGDTLVGAHSKIGGSFATANVRIDRGEIYLDLDGTSVGTGRRSFGSIIGENARFGGGVVIMPGIIIGDNCTIGPGVMVRANVPEGTTLY
ncbi:MAG: hypothetical protein JW727_03235 [Candidatus Aenigmarchaeota archaeon]|nr:hypothetical protein [Candidatus Aenigmarchaeota archaeon]